MIYLLIERIQKKQRPIDHLVYSKAACSASEQKSVIGNTTQTCWVKKETRIHDAWNSTTMAPQIFAQYHLPHCDKCAVRFDENLEEAADAYQIPLDFWMMALNFSLVEKEE